MLIEAIKWNSAQHTSSINSIVDPAEFLNCFQHELLDLLGAGDICLDD